MSGKHVTPGTRSRDDDHDRSARSEADREGQSGSRDNTFDPDLERERLEPGMNAEGEGESGADPNRAKPLGNSNT